MSYLTQMSGLAVQQFVSAGVGLAVLAAVVRGLARRSASELGNFWSDLMRRLYATSFSMGAREMAMSVTSRALRWGREASRPLATRHLSLHSAVETCTFAGPQSSAAAWRFNAPRTRSASGIQD